MARANKRTGAVRRVIGALIVGVSVAVAYACGAAIVDSLDRLVDMPRASVPWLALEMVTYYVIGSIALVGGVLWGAAVYRGART